MNNASIAVTQLSLPKGGGALQGMGETFQTGAFTGTASLSIPLPLSACRDFKPDLNLAYSSGSGNGLFGLGWGLSLPTISRKTSKGQPRYDETDTFLLSHAEDLVPILNGQRQETRNAILYKIVAYHPRLEGLFATIEHWIDQQGENSYWRVVSKDNITSLFGTSANSRIVDPENPNKVFQWLLAETFDARGNHSLYEYSSENSTNVPATLSEVNRTQTANKYIRRIAYGNAQPFQEGKATPDAWHFEVIFDYGEYLLDPTNHTPYTPVQSWTNRADAFSTYQAGFEIRTHRLCRNIFLFHRFFQELGSDSVLIHTTHFDYEESPVVTLLRSVESIGFRIEDGTYTSKRLPPLEFTYTPFQPSGQVFEPLQDENGQFLPGLNLAPHYQLIDLYGEGIPGILYSDGRATLYWEPDGPGNGRETEATMRYAPPQVPSVLPIESQQQGINPRLMDLTGNGQLNLVVSTPTGTGYYEVNPDRSWKPYQTFPAFPNNFSNPDNYLVDVTGDGLADLLLIENDRVWVSPSLGKDGFGTPHILPRENGLPLLQRGAVTEVVQFADLLGTGARHLVRVTNGKVECWPNLGYGRFGKPVLLENAPHYREDFDASRLFLADLDGSGTTDIVYVYPDHVEIFFNQSGNSFSDALSIPLPVAWDRINQIEFADVLGNGTTCLLVSENHPQPRHWCYDFSRQQKPYLLNKIDNNLGAMSTITYCSSTKYYLADKKKGMPWIVNLPFPMQVVEKTESFDLISQTKLVSTYTYHHGHYDGIEREFRGFGMIERQDAETLSFESQPNDVPPVLTKTWYHTGAWQQDSPLSRQYEKEYFSGDADAHLLPDSVFDYADYQKQHPDYSPDGETWREVHRALKGTVLREEVYALDSSSLQRNPYTVTETNFSVRLLQPQGDNKFGVYCVHSQESLSYHYERNPDDPRIQHDFVLEVTPFGDVKKACTVYYGRRPSRDLATPVYPEQTAMKATVQLEEFIEVTTPFRIIGVPYQQKAFEIAGLDLQGQPYFSFDRIREQVDGALNNQISYGVAFCPNTRQARLLSWQQSYFWNLLQDTVLPLGQITERALLHHEQQAVFSREWIQAVYGNKIDQAILSQEGGYFYEDNGYWWNKGLVRHYFQPDQPEKFYLLWKTENTYADQASPSQTDGLHARTIVIYDQPYYLLPVTIEAYITDTEKNVTRSLIDYHTLTPWQVTDMNQIIHQVSFDPLGMVIATSVFKEAIDGNPRDGDETLLKYEKLPDATFDQILAHQTDYLQEATTFFYYNLFAWKEKQQPASSISLMRQTHVSDLLPGQLSGIQVSVAYSDGFGRIVEEKQGVEPEEDLLRDERENLRRDRDGQPARGETDTQWLVSGRTAYNNKGKMAEKYLPYYSNTALFEAQQEIVTEKLVPPTVFHYDPLLRQIRVDTPKGFFSKVEFTPWETKHYDENDTVKDAPYYHHFMQTYPANPTQEQKNERDALEKAAAFYDTPHMTVLDTVGNTFLDIQNNLGSVSEDAFHEIVTGSLSSKEVWATLLAKGYLIQKENEARTAGKFQPYSRGFQATFLAELAPLSPPVAEAILRLLQQDCLTSYHAYDIQRREIASIDPRLYYSNITTGTAYYNFHYYYAMGADNTTPLVTDSADAGLNLSLHNISGSVLWSRSPRNFDQVISYDRLQRPVKIRVKGLKHDGTVVTDNIVETFTYGETQPQAKKYNLRGQLYQHQDQSGVIINDKYNIEGALLETTRQFTREYKDYINWDTSVQLETERYTKRCSFNALQQLITEITPDGSITTNTYNQGGLLNQVTVQFKDGTAQPVINHIEYNANRERLAISYANGVNTTYTYEETTLHLLKLYSTRPGKDATGKDRKTAIQDITYTYDPVGNITRTYDQTSQTVFYNNQKVEPLSDYTYDGLYRLIKANGRQHPGINATTYRNNEQDGNFKQSKFIPLPDDTNKLENYHESYSYDEGGNLIQTTHLASSSWTRSQNIMPDSNRLKSISSQNGTNDSVDMSYDKSGNLKQLHINSAVSLTWSCCENLVKVGIIQRPNEPDDSDYYTYDSSEQRTRKVSERLAGSGALLQKEEKIYLGNFEIKRLKQETPQGETTILKRQTLRVMDDRTCVAILHYWEQDTLQREVDREGTRKRRYQLDNHLGSVSLEVDEDAEIVSYEEYFPYGGTALLAGKNQREVKLKEYRYSGKERDDTTGLYYYGARYYAPWLGRWMSPDPAGTVDGLNLYAFVVGNPINHVDKDGRMFRLLRGGPSRIRGGKGVAGQQKRTKYTNVALKDLTQWPNDINQLKELNGSHFVATDLEISGTNIFTMLSEHFPPEALTQIISAANVKDKNKLFQSIEEKNVSNVLVVRGWNAGRWQEGDSSVLDLGREIKTAFPTINLAGAIDIKKGSQVTKLEYESKRAVFNSFFTNILFHSSELDQEQIALLRDIASNSKELVIGQTPYNPDFLQRMGKYDGVNIEVNQIPEHLRNDDSRLADQREFLEELGKNATTYTRFWGSPSPSWADSFNAVNNKFSEWGR
jgi:RHS repeat-associated protein